MKVSIIFCEEWARDIVIVKYLLRFNIPCIIVKLICRLASSYELAYEPTMFM